MLILTGERKAGFSRLFESSAVLPLIQSARGNDSPHTVRVSLTDKNTGGFPFEIADSGILPCPQAAGAFRKLRLF